MLGLGNKGFGFSWTHSSKGIILDWRFQGKLWIDVDLFFFSFVNSFISFVFCFQKYNYWIWDKLEVGCPKLLVLHKLLKYMLKFIVFTCFDKTTIMLSILVFVVHVWKVIWIHKKGSGSCARRSNVFVRPINWWMLGSAKPLTNFTCAHTLIHVQP